MGLATTMLVIGIVPYLVSIYLEFPHSCCQHGWRQPRDNERAVFNRFLGQAPAFLTDRGSILLLLSSLTGIETVRERMASVGLLVHEVASVRCPGERLVVLRGSRPPGFNMV